MIELKQNGSNGKQQARIYLFTLSQKNARLAAIEVIYSECDDDELPEIDYKFSADAGITMHESRLGGRYRLKQHDKLINIAAKKILSPQGLFRRGTSRTWVDDNGYFIIFVSFGPSNWSQSARLGVGIDFLWKYDSEGFNTSFSYSYGDSSIEDFFEYDGNDAVFQAEMELYSKIGLQKVMEYRNFRDMAYAKRCLEQQVLGIPENRRFWEYYNLAMLCFLKGDYESGRKIFETFLTTLKESFYIDGYYIDWHEKLYQYCLKQIVPHLTSQRNAQQMVVDRIKQRRDFLNSKVSFKKFGKEDFILP